MARVLLGSLSLLGGTGCLILEDDKPLPEDPVFRNHTPYFVNVSPSFPYLETDNCPGAQLEFRVNVADPEVNDSVGIRYYVDFPTQQGFETEDDFTNDGNETRPDTKTFEPFVELSNRLGEPGVHVVEAVVFDGNLSPSRQPEPRAVYPDAGVNPSFVIVAKWVVETEACPTP